MNKLMMEKNVDAKISIQISRASSWDDAEPMSTSPILDTAKIRDRAKLRLKRRTSDASANSPIVEDLGQLSKRQKSCGEKVGDECPSCDFAVGEPAAKSSDDSKLTLVERLRQLKRQKKNTARRSLRTDEQIDDEEFVRSARMLDAACFSTPSVKFDETSPKRPSLGLRSFSEVERSNPSDAETPKVSHSVTHLSLDEDKEEDLFADPKDNAEVVDDLEDFSQWKYDRVDKSPELFHGFSEQEYCRSRERSQRISQFWCEVDEVSANEKIVLDRGFSVEDLNKSRDFLDNWKLVLKKYYPYCWSDWFVDVKLEMKNNKNLGDDERIENSILNSEINIEIESNEIKLDNNNHKNLDNDEKIERIESSISNAEMNIGIESNEIKLDNNNHKNSNNDEKIENRLENEQRQKLSSFNDEKSNDASNAPSTCGFATASGRPIRVSSKALEKAQTRMIEEAKKIKNEMFDDDSNETKILPDPTIFQGEDLLHEDDEWMDDDFSEPRDPSRTLEGHSKIFEPTIDKLQKIPCKKDDSESSKIIDNEIPSTSRSEKIKMDGKLNFGFATAGGKKLKISEKSWSKAKAVFDSIDETSINDLAKPENHSNRSNSKIAGAVGKTETTTSGLFSNVNPDDSESSKIIANEIPSTSTSEIIKMDGKLNFGFATAGGKKLKISEKSWSKAKAVFDSIDETSMNDLAKPENHSNRSDSKITSSIGKTETTKTDFSTAGGRSINVATKAVSAAENHLFDEFNNLESLDFNDFTDPFDEITSNTKKRKIDEADEDTPLRRDADAKRKRVGRYLTDLQGRKLFNDDSNHDDDQTTSQFLESNRTNVKNTIAKLDSIAERSNDSKIGWKSCQRTIFEQRNPLATFNRSDKVNDDVTDRADDSTTRENNYRPVVMKENDDRHDNQHESIPDDLTFETQFSQDNKSSPVIDRFIAETIMIMEGRLTMAAKQDETIRDKRRNKPEPCDGKLYRLRNSNRDSRIKWKQLTDGIGPTLREISDDNAGRDLSTVDASTAERYSFRCADFYGEKNVKRNIEGIKVGDEAYLILDEKNRAGPREFERAFLSSPNVDPNLVPTGWIKNHYRWIVWKLASMDRLKFGHKCLPRMLTPDRVMLELKYRYDREIYKTQWPPLKRILERGEDASARIVLCVSSIVPEEDTKVQIRGLSHTPSSLGLTNYKMRLSDGWYSIGASIDGAMMNFIRSGKVRVGTKLIIYGAKVVNLDQGCSALEIPESVTMRIYSNSTRRARWDTKLDFYHKNRGPMSFNLKSVKPNGGSISKIIVAVSRVYPILYREKLPDGQSVFRNERCDEEAARLHESRYQSKMEEIYATAWTEFRVDSMVDKKKRSSENARTGDFSNRDEFASCNRDVEEELRQRIATKMRECLPPPRNVTPVMKLRVADGENCALVTVWSTDRDANELFVEGSTIAIYNAFASGLRSNELQITAGRSTFVKRVTSRQICYPKRIYTSLSEIIEPGFNPVYGEFDTIGVVASIGPAPYGMKNFETVNLACPRLVDDATSDFLSILFWQGVSSHGYTKILTVGSLVACSNLEWRKNTTRSNIPTAYCTERSVFTKNPRQNYFVQPFEILRNRIKDTTIYAANCASLIDDEIAKRTSTRTPIAITPYRPSTSDNRTPGWSPRDSNSTVDCVTPRYDAKRLSTNRRIERLNVYGEPPKLPSIVVNNSSRIATTEFTSPVVNRVEKS